MKTREIALNSKALKEQASLRVSNSATRFKDRPLSEKMARAAADRGIDRALRTADMHG